MVHNSHNRPRFNRDIATPKANMSTAIERVDHCGRCTGRMERKTVIIVYYTSTSQPNERKTKESAISRSKWNTNANEMTCRWHRNRSAPYRQLPRNAVRCRVLPSNVPFHRRGSNHQEHFLTLREWQPHHRIIDILLVSDIAWFTAINIRQLVFLPLLRVEANNF